MKGSRERQRQIKRYRIKRDRERPRDIERDKRIKRDKERPTDIYRERSRD